MLTSSSTRENASCLLLKLPQEIKDEIYELVFQKKMLHISERRIGVFTNEICFNEETEMEAQAKFDKCQNVLDETVGTLSLDGPTFHHFHCGHGMGNSQRAGIALLLCCRQLHQEAKHLAYLRYNFSFHNAASLREFIFNRSESQATCIRNLRLQIHLGDKSGVEDWQSVLALLTHKLKNVKNLDLHLVVRPGTWARHVNQMTDSLGGLAKLPLLSATVIFSDDHSSSNTLIALEYRQLFSQGLREHLLGGEMGDPVASTPDNSVVVSYQR